MIIISEGIFKVCDFVFLFAEFNVNSFNFISNIICFGTEWKCWFEMLKEVFIGGFSIETSVNFTSSKT